ncbi:MAG: sigma-70 family RNA polymerase sigma factor [Lachnospiraceae bacterium]|jgi:RNA polymerase primary sigma factor
MEDEKEFEDLEQESPEEELPFGEEEEEDEETLEKEILEEKDEELTRGVAESGALGDTYRSYCHEIARYPRVTAQEELDLAKRVESGQIAYALLKNGVKEAVTEEDLAGITTVSSDVLSDRKADFIGKTEDELTKISADGKDARDTLTQANLRLVISVAKRYDRRNSNLTIMDLIQEGNIGLMHAVEKFDYRRNNRFSTYAIWWIRQTIRRAIEEQSRTIRIPGHMVEVLSRMRKAEKELTQKLGREPGDDELAKELSTTQDRILELRQMQADTTSLNTPTNREDDGDGELGDFVADPDGGPATGILEEGMKKDLNTAVDHLPERERYVVRERYGLDGKAPRTLEEIGKELGVTKERVRQIEVHAFRRILKSKDAAKLREYLEG